MSDPETPSFARHFPTFRRLLAWMFSWRTIRRCLFVLACLVTLIALFYAEENWRGRHSWNKYRQELEARGAQLDYHSFIPKPVPDEQNFASTPLVQSWFLKAKGANGRFETDDYAQASRIVSDSRNKDWGRRQFEDLIAWKMAFGAIRSGETNKHEMSYATNRIDLESRAAAAPAVLEGLKSSESELSELRAASRRPYAHYPVNYDLANPWGILLPHLARIEGAVQRLQLRACAELVVGQKEDALEDVKLALYLADTLKEEPILISYLVRLECLQIASRPVWEGVAEHGWSDAQLQVLQSHLREYNFLADMKRPLDGERATGVLTADLLRRRKYRPSEFGSLEESDSPAAGLVDFIMRVAPRGWYHLEQLRYCRLYESQMSGTFDATKERVFPEQIGIRTHELEREIAGSRLGKTFNAVIHHQFVAALLLPALGKVSEKAAAAQTCTDQAALACVLERHRLVSGQYPNDLDSLVPRFIENIPNDVISGGSLKYRRLADARFALYSVGWNERDDGGTPGKSLFDEKEGDWVWFSSPQ